MAELEELIAIKEELIDQTIILENIESSIVNLDTNYGSPSEETPMPWVPCFAEAPAYFV